MGFPPWLSRTQTDYHLIVWWSSFWIFSSVMTETVVWRSFVTQSQQFDLLVVGWNFVAEGRYWILSWGASCRMTHTWFFRGRIKFTTKSQSSSGPKLWRTSKFLRVQHAFTKMSVSPLIMVRFSKFEVWHAQHFDPDLQDVSDVTRDVTRARNDYDVFYTFYSWTACPIMRHGMPSNVRLGKGF